MQDEIAEMVKISESREGWDCYSISILFGNYRDQPYRMAEGKTWQ